MGGRPRLKDLVVLRLPDGILQEWPVRMLCFFPSRLKSRLRRVAVDEVSSLLSGESALIPHKQDHACQVASKLVKL